MLSRILATDNPKATLLKNKLEFDDDAKTNHANDPSAMFEICLMFMQFQRKITEYEPWFSWAWICPAFENSVDPDQLASEEANWSGSALFVIQYVSLYGQSGLSNLIGWQLEMGVAFLFSMTSVN